jgi:hypothetical protein
VAVIYVRIMPVLLSPDSLLWCRHSASALWGTKQVPRRNFARYSAVDHYDRHAASRSVSFA